jgi:radical SAM protein with 4Fe4S-binding SPASM domain
MTLPLPTDYGLVLSELTKRAAACRQPVNGTFELSERCNLSCSMCYVRQSAKDHAQRLKELSASEWLRLAQDAADNGMVFLLLTGGEIFLRSDFFEIYGPLRRMGLVLTLYTNGTLITDETARRLADAPPNVTEITLYGASAAVYEAVTGVRGSYAHCLAGIEALLRHGIPLGLKTTLSRQNIGELGAMQQMARDWGVPFRTGWLLNRRRDGRSSDIENCRMSVKDSVALEAVDRASALDSTEAALREPSMDQAQSFRCHAGKSVFVVNSSGEMNACLQLPQPMARPLATGFRAAWEHVQRFVDEAPPLSQTCFSCKARAYCLQCPSWSWLESGTLTEPVPYLCEIAFARRERQGQDA